jgi:glyoxylase-like metal-dependent hydrolase (beta-lactamase superfamily II)
VELEEGVLRVTLPLPTGPRHVHCYLLRGDRGWTLVDTGLGVREAEGPWPEIVAGLDAPVERVFVTHFHPDHVGGAEPAAAATGARVLQGREDYERCADVWGRPDWSGELAEYLTQHGLPDRDAAAIRGEAALYGPMIRFVRDPEALEEGDEVAGWRVVHLPGHADGHLCLLRDGVLVAGDHLLPRITPTVGLYPRSRPDPLGDYLASLARTIELAPRLALPGHGDPIEDPVGRARELLEHHRERLAATAAALEREPRTAYDVSVDLFGSELGPSDRRFAVAESLAHLERLRREGRASRGDGEPTSWRAAQPWPRRPRKD